MPAADAAFSIGTLALTEGPARITAASGTYNFDTGQVAVPGPVNVTGGLTVSDTIVANGGLWRTLEGQKRDLDRMDPSLVKLDGRDGALRAQWRLPDPRLSIRAVSGM